MCERRQTKVKKYNSHYVNKTHDQVDLQSLEIRCLDLFPQVIQMRTFAETQQALEWAGVQFE